ncbi:hypothetical protein B0T22DRAFT_24151 [Podospora appendiculata]|uniref:HTH CENPB-type domain-containing protein n=1 Tax=Podospora appendiculata TaxID=314037 RepID=A0AAE0XGB8_9PEZI|nr:hypothetical protein B0T22DRAFT_24151 [Podospora appendiculata]
MHNQIIGSIGMDQESHIAHDNTNNNSNNNHNHNTYGNENWVDMNSYHHQTNMPDYGGGFGYIPPITHGLPSESLSRMPPPPPPQTMPQPQTNHTQLPMLMMPHAAWPSMLTNPNNYSQHSVPPVAIPPVTTPLKTSKLPAIQTTSQPRKTLTDDDRRRMCQYAEDHPGAKQTDIGAEFGVERSTVSKVLRNKEKYLSAEDRSSSPIKRTKGKTADIEKALTNYLRKAQESGIAVTADDIREKARLFSTTAGNPTDSYMKTNSSTWLEKFMLKHNNGSSRLMRRASETNIPDSIRGSPSRTSSQPSSAISPASPSVHPSPSPLSANRSDEEKESLNHYMDFTTESGGYKHSNSQSTTSLSSAFTDTATSSFSGSALSPTASFSFSPDPNAGGFLTDQNRQIPPLGGPGSNFQRPRSQTFPTLDLEYMNQPQNNEPLTPKYHVSSTAPSSALESSASETPASHFGLDHAITSPQLRHSSSNGSLTARSSMTPITASAVGSSPSSPTQEDAQRAADILLSFIRANGFGQDDYLVMARLVEKLRIQHPQLTKAAAHPHGMGGLSRIPEGDSEMPNAPPVMIKVEARMGA